MRKKALPPPQLLIPLFETSLRPECEGVFSPAMSRPGDSQTAIRVRFCGWSSSIPFRLPST